MCWNILYISIKPHYSLYLLNLICYFFAHHLLACNHLLSPQMMLQENKRVRKKIPTAFEELMGPHIGRVEDAIDPGLNKLSWTSLNIQEYIQVCS